MNYFTNPKQIHCFQVSLANLFIELGDKNTANQIYSRFLNHPLSNPPENILLSPQFVEDLTNNKYTAILEILPPKFNIEQAMKKSAPKTKILNYINAYQNQLDKGNIRFDEIFELNNTPCLALLQNPVGVLDHWVTIKDDLTIINDGIIKYDSNLEDRLLGILQVYKE